MVFSIFKKQSNKLPEQPAAKPRGEPPPRPGAPPAAPAAAKPPDKGALESFKDSIFGEDFTLSGGGIQVEHDVDPVKVDIEQAAVLFANGQDSAARAVLEAAARAHSGDDGERLWRMLLDLLQVLGDKANFEKLSMEFTQITEKSPPSWRQDDQPAAKAATGQSTVILQGVLAGSDTPAIAKLREAVDKKLPIQVNLGKLASLDDMAAGVLFDLFRKARKLGLTITLEGADGLIERLKSRLSPDQREYEKGWLLLLELLQLLGLQDTFEEKAVDYAIAFEVSPPSWEIVQAGKVKSVKVEPEQLEETYPLTGECKNSRFDDLNAFLEANDHPILDCSRLKRIDFTSAGTLRNIVETFHKKGKEVVIRHPHHLVAELLEIVGVNAVAKIIVTKF